MKANAVTLGVDTSNYATSLAVVDTAGEVVCAKKQFLPVKEGELGLRQSDAVFHHTATLPKLLAELRNEGALEGQVAAVGVSQKPRGQQGSYMPCFLAGVSFAAAFTAGARVPLIQTTHQAGHAAAALYAAGNRKLEGTSLLFHVSGGTTELLLCEGANPVAVLGKSLDLYAGQAVDRLGVRLGFPFPAGAGLSALAETATAEPPRPRTSFVGADCHLSGLQNQCEAMLEKGQEPALVARYCLYAIADTLVAMAKQAQKNHPGLPLVCAGGVMSSTIIRTRMQAALPGTSFVPGLYASDNAIGVAILAAKESALWPT